MSRPVLSESERKTRLEAWLGDRLDAKGVEVEGLAPPPTGMSSETRLFEASWRGEGGVERLDAVLRAAPTGEGPFPSYDMALQFHVMDRVRRHTSVPVPEVVWLEEDPAVLGVPFLVMKRVEGEAPLDFRPSYHAAGFYREASPAHRRGIWQGVIDGIAALHAADWRAMAIPGLPGGASGELDPGAAPLAYWRDYYLGWLKDTPDEPIHAYDEALDYLEGERPADARTTLVWGDGKLGNVMFAPASADPSAPHRVAAIVDWEMATIGDPEMDLASLLISDERAREDAGESLDGTPDEETLVAMYESASGERVLNFHYAQVFATFWRGCVQLKVMRSMRAQGMDIPEAMLTESLPVRTLRRLLDL
jgi:aminoglycoside phosphotransferase (APT) family kinase protein